MSAIRNANATPINRCRGKLRLKGHWIMLLYYRGISRANPQLPQNNKWLTQMVQGDNNIGGPEVFYTVLFVAWLAATSTLFHMSFSSICRPISNWQLHHKVPLSNRSTKVSRAMKDISRIRTSSPTTGVTTPYLSSNGTWRDEAWLNKFIILLIQTSGATR